MTLITKSDLKGSELKEFRRKAKELINDQDVSHHIAGMDLLKKEYGHTCILINEQPSGEKENYNCHAFSLGIHENEAVLHFKQDIFKGTIRNSWFNFGSIAEKCLTLVEDGETGDIICYLNKPTRNLRKMNVLHSGRYIGNSRIVSKWGRNSHIWEHDIKQVPSVYEDINGEISTVFFLIDQEALMKYVNYWENQFAARR